MNAIEIEHLRRVFRPTIGAFRRTHKEIVAVEDISFSIEAGELFGLLGPNGAGKTTTIKMLTTLLLPTSGEARVLGLDVVKEARKVQGQIGFIFGGERGLYWRLSGLDNLRYFASLYHVDPEVSKKRIPYLLELVGLNEREKERVEGYSRGMKQRLHVARTLLHDPPVLFLDEPTIGLDPVGARDFRQVIRDLQHNNKTILLTTHYMFEADQLCNRIGVINQGRLAALDTPASLKELVRDLSVIEVEVFGIPAALYETIKARPYVDSIAINNQEQKQLLLINSLQGAEVVPLLMNDLNGLRVGKVLVREPTLEDAYVRLVGGEV